MASRPKQARGKHVLLDSFKRVLRVIDNGHVIEKLRHRRHPRGPRRYIEKEAA